MPSMDGGSGVGGGAMMTNSSFRDLERSAPLVDSLAAAESQLHAGATTVTDNNGNNLPTFSYTDLKGITAVAQSKCFCRAIFFTDCLPMNFIVDR